MKNIIGLAFCLVLILHVFSCTDLEENPKGLLAPEGFFKTPEDVNAAIYGAYAEWVTTQVEKEYFLSLMLRSDMVDVGDRNTAGDRIAINDFRMDPSNNMIRQSWNRLYQAISAANTAIAASRHIDEDESVTKEMVAKARFLRPFTCIHSLRYFGDVPYMDSPVKSAEVLDANTRTSEEEIYKNIKADLAFTKENLPMQ